MTEDSIFNALRAMKDKEYKTHDSYLRAIAKVINGLQTEEHLLQQRTLEWYANERHYFPRSLLTLAQDQGIRLAPVYGDLGELARAALGDQS